MRFHADREPATHFYFFFFFKFLYLSNKRLFLYGMYEIKAMFRLVMDFNVEITCFDHKHVHGK